MAITRRSFLAGLGAVTVGLLFRRQLDGVLDSLERDQLVDEPTTPDQAPSAAEIVVCPQVGFRPDRLIVSNICAAVFLIEDIRINAVPQLAGAVPGEMFTSSVIDGQLALDLAPAGAEIRFRVRYIGNDPLGARFIAALIGRTLDSPGRQVMMIDSGVPIIG